MSNGPLPRLEPMDFGMLLDRTFRLYFNNFAQLLAIVAIVYVPFYATQLIFQATLVRGVGNEDLRMTIGAGAASLIFLCLWGVIGLPLATGAATFAISERFLGGRISTGRAYARSWTRLGSIIWAQILVGLVTFVGFLLAVVPGVFFMLCYTVVIPAILLEGLKATHGMDRSWKLSRGYRWKILGLLVILGLIGWFASGFVQTIPKLLLLHADVRTQLIVDSVSGAVASLLVEPLRVAAVVLIYYDLRIRKEGFDLEMLSRALGAQPLPVVPLPGQDAGTWPQAPGPSQYPPAQYPPSNWPPRSPGT